MADIRLNQEHRHYLSGLMTSSVGCPEEEKAMGKAYNKLAPMVRKMVEARFSPAEMKVLAKYDHVTAAVSPKMQLTAGGVDEFQFIGAIKSDRHWLPWREMLEIGVPLVPGSWAYHDRTLYAADDKITAAFGTWKVASDAHAKCLATKHRDYAALIKSATTLEQIEEVWPEAGTLLRKRISATLPVVLSDDVMTRIRADAANRKKVKTVEVSEDFVRRAARSVKTQTVFEPEEFEGQP